MKLIINKKILLASFLLCVLFSFNLSIPQLVQNIHAYPSAYISEAAAKNDPFYKSARADQIIFDYFPSNDKKEADAATNELINQLINSLVEEKVAKPEICGDGQDNDGNGVVDEYCNIPQGGNQSPPAVPEQEICGDGQDNDGNGVVDENCNVSNNPQGGNQSPPAVPEQEICGDGQDNDGNGVVDEYCNIPQGGNQSPPAVPEQEICGDGQDNDGNGVVDENCNVSSLPQLDSQSTQSTDQKKKSDKFGILKIYPTKSGSEQWYMSSNPDKDPRFSPQTKLTKNSDGSF